MPVLFTKITIEILFVRKYSNNYDTLAIIHMHIDAYIQIFQCIYTTSLVFILHIK